MFFGHCLVIFVVNIFVLTFISGFFGATNSRIWCCFEESIAVEERDLLQVGVPTGSGTIFPFYIRGISAENSNRPKMVEIQYLYKLISTLLIRQALIFLSPLVNLRRGEISWLMKIVFVTLFFLFQTKFKLCRTFSKTHIRMLWRILEWWTPHVRCCLPLPLEILRKRWQHLVIRPSCYWWWWCNSPCHHRWPIRKGAAADSILRFLCQVAAGIKIPQTNFNAAQLSFSIPKRTKQSNNSGSVEWKFAGENSFKVQIRC